MDSSNSPLVQKDDVVIWTEVNIKININDKGDRRLDVMM